VVLYVVVGDDPPKLVSALGDPTAVIDAQVNYRPRSEADRLFWQPFKAVGWAWDAGWLGAYILIYVPLMILAKFLLRVP
jgi:hypothetical protein